MAKPYGLWKRGKVYYYRIGTGKWKSTSCTRQDKAHDYALERLEEEKRHKEEEAKTIILRDYLDPFYIEDRCPHVARLRAEKHPISIHHIKLQRTNITKYIFEDEIADRNLRELRRADIIDFRQRLLNQGFSDSKVNKVIKTLKTCIKEGIFREELDRDPTLGVGNIREEKQERGAFTQKELANLFPPEGLGPWPDLAAYTCFLVAATTGMRRGEILAIQWKDIDFDNNLYHVRRAWKNDHEIGLPKWERVRENLPLPEITAKKLKELRSQSLHILPDAFVFHKKDGARLSTLWWQNTFTQAMVKAKIKAKERNITPHSFRHSLNTYLRDQGVADEKIRAALGWSSAKIQADYTHWKAEHLREQATVIDNLFNAT